MRVPCRGSADAAPAQGLVSTLGLRVKPMPSQQHRIHRRACGPLTRGGAALAPLAAPLSVPRIKQQRPANSQRHIVCLQAAKQFNQRQQQAAWAAHADSDGRTAPVLSRPQVFEHLGRVAANLQHSWEQHATDISNRVPAGSAGTTGYGSRSHTPLDNGRQRLASASNRRNAACTKTFHYSIHLPL